MNLIYGIKDKPKFGQMLVFAFQQVLAILAATIAVPAIVGNGMSASAALFGAGIGMVAVAMLWSVWMPIIKIIWTSSMALFAAGISFILLGIFYYFIDYKGYRKGLTWLKVYGMNSIVAYTLTQIINFRGVANSLFYGLEQYMGDWYQVLLTICHVGTIYLILWVMHRKKIYLKA